ncbi:MAG TPA: TIGR00730 family Rossman fold protein [Thermoanaerobaculia bacterium]|nr:TIGR00730 family Rossman fold protein [Thermoanaerobaculia bacterium]
MSPRRIASICVFCGSHPGRLPAYAESARRLGERMAARGFALVYGGGKVGLMGILADAVLAGGGKVVGVIPEALLRREVGHGGVTELLVVDSMHERKALMAERSDAFVALPGGLGTFEELFEVWTWGALGIHAKPCGLLDVAGYYEWLVASLDHAVEEGFVRRGHRDILLVESDIDRLLDRLEEYEAPRVEQWLEVAET